MPPIRRPLGEISGNRVRATDLTPYTRGLIMGTHRFRVKEAVIMEEFSVSRGAVRGTIKNDASRPNGEI